MTDYDYGDADRRPGIDPTPEEIRKRCAAIRATWSEETRMSRRV
jgi:hypothetical protein